MNTSQKNEHEDNSEEFIWDAFQRNKEITKQGKEGKTHRAQHKNV